MKVYNLGNDFALAERLEKANVSNKVVETAKPAVEHKEAKELAETTAVPEVPAKTDKKKKV